MTGSTLINRRFTNYGVAVAAAPFVSMVAPVQVPVDTAPVLPAISASHTRGWTGWLDGSWSEIKLALEQLSRQSSTVAPVAEDLEWFETPGDVVYPLGLEERLDVVVVEDLSADPFRFTDTDYDVWTW